MNMWKSAYFDHFSLSISAYFNTLNYMYYVSLYNTQNCQKKIHLPVWLDRAKFHV